MDFTERVYEDVDWIYLIQVRYQWQALVNMMKNLQTSEKGQRMFLLPGQLSVSQT
jgi:hypothetical protein